MIRLRAALAAGAMLASMLCGSTAQAQKVPFARPPYAGAYEPQGIDERGIWMQVDEGERALRLSPFVLNDAALNDFIRGVLCRTVGEERCRTVRIYVVKDGSFNASMAPNGLMMVNTGLLARLHSEAELASVLGHEFGHFEQRHTLKQFRALRGTTDAMAWIGLIGAATNTPTGSTQNALAANYFRFNRSEEAEADALAVQFVRASPYRLCASEVWRRVIAEDDALRAERGLRKLRRISPGLGDTHPTELQRLDYFAALEAEAGSVGEEGIEPYRAVTDRVLPMLFDSLIKGNDFAGADYVLRSRGEAMGWNGELLYLRGELYRQRGNPRDLVTARGLFQQAIEQPGAPAESWRGLGMTALRLGDAPAGKAALAQYLARAPSAADAVAVRMVMEN